jgi:membrane protease YdiL (CAAX protease family)
MAVNDPYSAPRDLEPQPAPASDVNAIPEVLPAAPQPPFVLPAKRPHPGFWWSVLWCVIFLIVTQIIPGLGVLFVAVLVDLLRSGDPKGFLEYLPTPEGQAALNQQVTAPAIFVGQLCVSLFSLLVLRFVVGKDWPRQVAFRLPALRHVMLAVMGLPALTIIASFIGALAKQHIRGFHELGFDVETQIKLLRHLPLAFLFLGIAVLPGFGEELWCRAFLGRGLVARYGAVGGVLLTSCFFGAIHLDPPQAIGAAAIGIGLHLAYLASRSLLVPMLLHFLNNSLGVLSLTRPDSVLQVFDNLPDDFRELRTITFYAVAVGLLLAVGWAMYQSRARVVSGAGAEPSWRPAFPGVECPPPGSGSVIVVGRPSPTAMVLATVAYLALLFLLLRPALMPAA